MKRLFFVIILIISLSILVSCGQSGHKFTDWEESKRYTCTEDGEHVRHCTDCGLVQVAPIPARHTEVIDEAVEATCTQTGLTEGKHCSVCEKVIVAQTETPRIPHTYEEDSVICTVCGFNREEDCDHLNVEILEKTEVTCTENGLTEGKACLDCGEVLLAQEEIVAPGHSEVIDEAVDPTCTEKGLTEGKHCSACDEVLTPQVDIDALGHSYDNDEDESCNACEYVRDLACKHENVSTIPSRDAGCTEAGLTEGKVCIDCEEVLLAQEEISALGHTEVSDEAVEATCSEAGLTEGKHCSVCKEVLVAQTETEKKPHTEVIDEAVEPTLNSTGLTEGKHCSVCGTTLIPQEIIPALVSITINNADGFTVSGLKSAYAIGDEVSLSVSVGEEYKFLGWYVNDAMVSDKIVYNFTMPDENITIFIKIAKKYNLTVDANSPSFGTVKGSTLAAAGDKVEAEAYPQGNYTFVGWYNNDQLISKDRFYTFYMPEEDYTLVAKFVSNSKLNAKVWSGGTASGFDSGSGTADDPYIISTGEQLAYMAMCVNNGSLSGCCFSLANSIDLNGYEWTPIGTNENEFEVYFSGNEHVIFNFKITSSLAYDTCYYGLFGYVESGMIENLGVEDFTIDVSQAANIYAGGLVGRIGSLSGGVYVSGCYSIGHINIISERGSGTYDAYAGGLIGASNGSKYSYTNSVSGCNSNVDVYAQSTDAAYAGGLIGYSRYIDAYNSYAKGDVESTDRAGGFAGYSYEGVIRYCYATGNVTTKGAYDSSYTGGFIGQSYNTPITTCYATGKTTSLSYWAGGFIGYVSGDAVIDSCYATGKVYANGDAGGLVGYNCSPINNCYATGIVESERFSAGGLVGTNYGGIITNSYAIGDVVSKNDIRIGGLVGANSNGSVVGCYATGDVYSGKQAGGLIGNNFTDKAVKDCYATGNVILSASYTGYAGGLIGDSYYASIIENCYATGNVTASGTEVYAGAFIGYIEGNGDYTEDFLNSYINNCFATGDVNVSAESVAYAGHFIGLLGENAILTGCYYADGQTVILNCEQTSSNTEGALCTTKQLNSKDFYISTLGWSEDVWSVDYLDFENHIIPSLYIFFHYSDGLEYVSNGDGTCYVSGIGSCEDTKIIIPYTSPEGHTVTGISLLGGWGYSYILGVVIPDSVTRIEDYAFAYCHDIQSITIGKNVSYIGSYAFAECWEVDEIQYNGTMEEWNNITKVNDWNIAVNECTVHCIDGDVDASNYNVCT